MSKRGLIAVVAFLLLAAACGKEGGSEANLAVEGATATPSTTSKAPQASATASAAAGGAATPAPGAQTGQTETAAKPPPAAQGGVNTPKDGRYVYDYKGESTSPFNPGGPQKFQGELTIDVSHQGSVYQNEETTTVQPGRVTTRTRWESNRILLLYVKVESQGGDFSCEFDPPLLIAKIPIKPETFPTQDFKGKGNACNGKLDITVVGKEPAKDASGRSWSTWRVRVRTQTNTDQGSQSSDETRWFSPDLGAEIRTQGTFKTQFGASKFEGNATSVLKRHP
jgi:hypothetical protein